MRRLFKVGSDRHDVGRVTFSWHPDGNFLASAGKNGIVHITDRHGDIVDEIPMSTAAPVLSLAWDKDGDYLAILQDGNGVVPLWSLTSRRVVPLETNLRDPTFLAWSKTGPQLAVGTAKGNLLIYNKTKKQKIPIVGKHGKRICCGDWSKGGNKLVLGSEDRTYTISNENGDTLIHNEVKDVPTEIYFTNMMGTEGRMRSGVTGGDDDSISASLDGKSLLLHTIVDEKEDPFELTFGGSTGSGNCKYGDITHHCWYEDGLVMIGFSLGYILIIAANPKEMGQERSSMKLHKNNLTSFTYNPHMKRVASVGDDGVRILDTRDFKESKQDYISPEDLEDGRISDICWSPDGQILTIGTYSGNVYNFLAKMNILNAHYGTTAAYLSSLREITVIDAVKRSRAVDVTLRLEPSLIAIGAKHVAAGMNNKVYYHRIASGNGSQQVFEQEYVGTVREVQLNHTYAVVLTDNTAKIHPIESGPDAADRTRSFPSRDEGSYAKVTCIALTDDFLFYGTEAGTVEVFFLGEWVLLPGCELRLDKPIKQLHPNNTGTRVVVVDTANQCYMFNPVNGGGVNQSITRFDSAPTNISSVIWDLKDKYVVMLYDGKYAHTYVFVQTSMKGALLSKLGPVTVSGEGEIKMETDKIEIPAGTTPILSIGGVISCQTVSGTLTTSLHQFFDQLPDTVAAGIQQGAVSKKKDDGPADKKTWLARFCQAIALLKLETAWQAALELDRRQYWLALSNKAMEMLNVELALRVYRQLGDAGMVMSLQELQHVEDRYLLAGHISLLFCDYQRAQDLFLASSRPTAALEMRRDLLQWDQALKLAQALAPTQIPDICVRFGQQLEFRDEIDAALKMYESALHTQDENGNNACPESLVPLAMIGVARCNLRLGNIRQGIRMANDLEDKQLYADCGEILEQQKQYTDATDMYVKGEQFERAAVIYTKYLIKNDKGRIAEAAAIMEKVQNDQLNSDFAKACVVCQKYTEAVKAYERAKDLDKVVELKLRYLDQVQQAFDLVRNGASSEGAQIVADYCLETSDYRGAVEFLLIANKSDEAFKVSQSHSLVDVYASILGQTIGNEDALKVAHFYEKQQDFGRAGKFYSLCGQYARALKLFIQCGDREIDAAIDVVGKSQNEGLTHQLIDFLVGEKDGVPKDPNYIYRLYMALKKYDDAAKTALIIARQEQDLGNYVLAHSVVFETIRQLEDANIKVPLQLRQTFVLLHSYIRVKHLVKAGNHTGAARMLLRVAQNVSKFPMHVVPILTSTVIECQRAGLKASSYDYAVMLMRPEHRQTIDPNIKRKIEAIVRRRSQQGDDAPEDLSPCPISSQLIPESQLECPTTRDAIPMCVITGKHMVLEDWCFCPTSKSPALFSEYVRYIESELEAARAAVTAEESKDGGESKGGDSKSNNDANITALDPVLRKPVTAQDLRLCAPEEATAYIKKYNNVVEEKKKGGKDGDNTSSGSGENDDNNTGGGGNSAGVSGKSSGKDKDDQQGGSSRQSPSRADYEVVESAGKAPSTQSQMDSPDSLLKSEKQRASRNLEDDF